MQLHTYRWSCDVCGYTAEVRGTTKSLPPLWSQRDGARPDPFTISFDEHLCPSCTESEGGK